MIINRNLLYTKFTRAWKEIEKLEPIPEKSVVSIGNSIELYHDNSHDYIYRRIKFKHIEMVVSFERIEHIGFDLLCIDDKVDITLWMNDLMREIETLKKGKKS